jgi:hypothetical protein
MGNSLSTINVDTTKILVIIIKGEKQVMSTHHKSLLRFTAAVHKYDAATKKATFYLLNTTRNRNKWAPTEKALHECMPTLKGKPIGMGINYKTDKHYPEGQTLDAGVFVDFEVKDSYALGTAVMEDKKVIAMLENGLLGPVSVVLYAFYDTCSECWDTLDEANWKEHVHIANGQAYSVVHSFEFARVDFVDDPAFPAAAFTNFASHSDKTVPLTLLASVCEFSQQQSNKKLESVKEKNNLSENNKLENTVATLQSTVDELKKTVETVMAALKNQEEAVTKAAAAKVAELIDEASAARLAAGVITEAAIVPDKEMLKACNETALKQFIKEAKTKTANSSDPQMKYTGQAYQPASFEAALKEAKLELGITNVSEDASETVNNNKERQ